MSFLRDTPLIRTPALFQIFARSLWRFELGLWISVVYLREVHESASISDPLVMSKARVILLKPLTMPRQKFCILSHGQTSRLSQLLDIPNIYAWTNSAIVLCWLRKLHSNLETFVYPSVFSSSTWYQRPNGTICLLRTILQISSVEDFASQLLCSCLALWLKDALRSGPNLTSPYF